VTDYISQGRGKVVRIRFPNLGHILDLETLISWLCIVFRIPIVAEHEGIKFRWDGRIHTSDETVNLELNNIVNKNPDAQISFSDK
jgi:hypothetical protein